MYVLPVVASQSVWFTYKHGNVWFILCLIMMFSRVYSLVITLVFEVDIMFALIVLSSI